MPVGHLGPADVVTVAPGSSVEDVVDAMEGENVGAVVVDENGELAGIVTLDDLVATIGEQLDNVADTIEAHSPDYQP